MLVILYILLDIITTPMVVMFRGDGVSAPLSRFDLIIYNNKDLHYD